MESSYGHRGVFYQSYAMASNDMYLIFGHVGIGTTSPGQKLRVAGTIESTLGGFKFPDGTTQTTSATNAIGFHAYGSTQTIATGVTTTVIYPTVVFDKAGNYNSTTGVFTASTAGVYNATCSTDYEASGGTTAAPVDLMIGFTSNLTTVPDIAQRFTCSQPYCMSVVLSTYF